MSAPVTRRTSLVAGVATLAAGRAVAARPGLSPATVARLNAVCREQVAARRSAGLVARVHRRGQPLFAAAFGAANLETATRMSEASVLRVGSVSKQFAAASLLALQEAGKLSLGDPLAKFLPDFPRSHEVTLQMLLNHTSGIANISQGVVPWTDYSTAQIVAVIERQSPLYRFDPGTGWAYSNTAFNLAGAVIETATGAPFWRFYQQRLFAPAGMTATSVDARADVVVGRASGYTASPSSPSGFQNAQYLSWTIPGAAGCLRSTAIDMARWQAALFGGEVLSPASLALMRAPGRLKDGRLASAGRSGPAAGTQPIQEYGLGLELSDVTGFHRVGHYGDIPGFAADVGYYPDLGLGVVTLTNTDFGDANPPRALERVVLSDPMFVAAHP